jgi:hypothetical protein
MLISLSGRKSSGKTTIADLLLKKGFKKASFATALKEYSSQLFDWDINLLYTQDGKESILKKPVVWNKQACSRLEKIVNIPLFFEKDCEFRTRRQALQYLGTEVLRKSDPEFHIKEFTNRYKNGDFVCDDMRFINEFESIKKMGGLCIYICRPYFWDYSNHSSEISLNRKNFDYVLLNDGSQHDFLKKFQYFMENQTIEVSTNIDDLDHDCFLKPSNESAYWAGVLSSIGTFKKDINHSYSLELSSTNKSWIESFRYFLNLKKPIVEKFKDGKINYIVNISSPFLIEDLKLWNLEPHQSVSKQIPNCIEDNDDFIKRWSIGFNDSLKLGEVLVSS